MRGALVIAAILAMGLAAPRGGSAQEPARVLSWETGDNRSYLIPALEVPAFVFGLNAVDRLIFPHSNDFDVDWSSIEKNLTTAPHFDQDPFNVNQLGHPYQGNIYYGIARSTGLSYWESLLYTLGGSFLWETAGETTRPSINDHVATGLGGTFVGEAFFRMASLLLEGGGGTPGFWRELGAAVIAPPLGVNRLVFGERFDPVFPSRDPAIYVTVGAGATLTARVRNVGVTLDEREQDATLNFSMTYGLPGKPGYRYRRPFDYFSFDFTAVPNASDWQDAIENVSIRGLLAGQRYEWGEDYRGVWGIFGGFDYLSPQLFRLSNTNLALGTVGQWWLSRTVALQGAVLSGVGFGPVGTVADREERDYHYGVMPQMLLGVRLIFGELAMLEAIGRNYVVVGVDSAGREDIGLETVNRGTAALIVRLVGPHALGLRYVVSTRDARFAGLPDRHQSVQTVTLSYNFLGQRRFGAVEWRPGEMDR
jgi:hypothetical protein